MIVIGPSNTVLLVNASFSGVLGKSGSEMIGTSILTHAPASDIPVYDTLLDELIALEKTGSTRASLPHNQIFEHANRTRILCTGAVSIIRREGEQAALLYFIDRHQPAPTGLSSRAEQAEDTLRTMLDVVTDGVITTDSNGMILAFNRAASELLGYSQYEVIGKSVGTLMSKRDQRRHHKHMRATDEELSQCILGRKRNVFAIAQNGEAILVAIRVTRAVLGDRPVFISTISRAEAQAQVAPGEQALATPHQLAAEKPRANRLSARTILLVEDDALVRKSTRRVLASLGYNVLQANNGIEALAAMDAFDGVIDVVITDVVMPKMNGAELAAEVALRRPTQHVLFISGHTEDSIDQSGLLPKGVSFLQKPFKTRELVDILGDLLS
mgnify:CR=1 FL=1